MEWRDFEEFTARRPGASVGRAAAIVVMAWTVVTISAGCASGDPSSQGSTTESTKEIEGNVSADDPEEVEEFCDAVREWAQLLRDYDDAVAMDYYQGQQDALDGIKEMFTLIPQLPPKSIALQVYKISVIEPDPVSVSDAEEREAAVADVDEFVAETCDVRFSFAELDFTR